MDSEEESMFLQLKLHAEYACTTVVAYLGKLGLVLFSDVHIAGVGDIPVARITRLADPCPLPSSAKHKKLSDKEIFIYAPKPILGDHLYDKGVEHIGTPDECVQSLNVGGNREAGQEDAVENVDPATEELKLRRLAFQAIFGGSGSPDEDTDFERGSNFHEQQTNAGGFSDKVDPAVEQQKLERLALQTIFHAEYPLLEGSTTESPDEDTDSKKGPKFHEKQTNIGGYSDKVEGVDMQKQINFGKVDNLDGITCLNIEGVGKWINLQSQVHGIPFEMVEKFDPYHPIVAGGISPEKEKARLKQHSWQIKPLKTRNPINVSMGWRRHQTTPVYATKEHAVVRGNLARRRQTFRERCVKVFPEGVPKTIRHSHKEYKQDSFPETVKYGTTIFTINCGIEGGIYTVVDGLGHTPRRDDSEEVPEETESDGSDEGVDQICGRREQKAFYLGGDSYMLATVAGYNIWFEPIIQYLKRKMRQKKKLTTEYCANYTHSFLNRKKYKLNLKKYPMTPEDLKQANAVKCQIIFAAYIYHKGEYVPSVFCVDETEVLEIVGQRRITGKTGWQKPSFVAAGSGEEHAERVLESYKDQIASNVLTPEEMKIICLKAMQEADLLDDGTGGMFTVFHIQFDTIRKFTVDSRFVGSIIKNFERKKSQEMRREKKQKIKQEENRQRRLGRVRRYRKNYSRVYISLTTILTPGICVAVKVMLVCCANRLCGFVQRWHWHDSK